MQGGSKVFDNLKKMNTTSIKRLMTTRLAPNGVESLFLTKKMCSKFYTQVALYVKT